MKSEKQKIYLDMLHWVLPTLRGGLSFFARVRLLRLVWLGNQQRLHEHYEIAELCHKFALCLSAEEFTHADLWFLNNHARSYLTNPENTRYPLYNRIAFHVQELFALVPDEMRHQLEWAGPEGDYSQGLHRRGARIFP